ncbi:MAG TPA: DUF2188 domain-containing protein [Ignavibacteria bacterium]|nr:DUF2188 domain-containing protein [Ignavibacteria bacterium]
MRRQKNQHVLPHGNMWAVKGDSNLKNTVLLRSKKEAIKIAGRISKNQKSELIIHTKDGRITGKDSHGRDPFPPKG